MSVLNRLIDEDAWNSFLQYKESQYVPEKEWQKLKDYIQNKKYLKIAQKIVDENYTFSIPNKKIINKNGSYKKRIVYSYSEEETLILKMIHYLFFEYDSLLAPNCYSFRKNIGPKQAFKQVTKGVKGYGYKVDIHNYFNSISVSKLLNILQEEVDRKDYNFLKKILENKKVLYKGEIIEEEKGVMAGTPISCFLSNLYLSKLDFAMQDVCYARYADDIIIFAPTQEELTDKIKYMHHYFASLDLVINPDKECYITPGEPFEFLGFSYYHKVIDLSSHAKKKMKAKIRRKAKALRRWMLRKNLSSDKAIKAMNNIFNYKFFYEKKGKELNWSIWYFPILTTDKGLREIDHYFQEQLRYIKTGNHHCSNMGKVPYSYLKELGYRSLVHEYYQFQKHRG